MNNYTIFILICLIFSSIVSCKVSNNFSLPELDINKYGAYGDGIHDDTQALQNALNDAHQTNSIVYLGDKKSYLINKRLLIRSNIEGQGSTIIPKLNGEDLIKIAKNKISINNLNILPGNYRNIRVDSDNVTFNNCNIVTDNSFTIFLINGNGLIVKNCKIENHFNESRNLVFFSTKAISNLLIENCKIYGGLYFSNKELKKAGFHKIINSYFEIDFSHANQSFSTGHDGISYYGFSNITFENDTFNLKNINRGFKFSDVSLGSKNYISEFTSSNVLFDKCIVHAKSINGKQLFDFYRGTGSVQIDDCLISSEGHTVVFENKTTQSSDIPFEFILNNSKVYYDFKLLYLRDNKHTMNKVEFQRNSLIYTSDKYVNFIKRNGQEKEIPAPSLLGVYGIKSFTFNNNVIVSKDNISIIKPTLFLSNVSDVFILNNRIDGFISFRNYQNNHKIRVQNNKYSIDSKKPFILIDKSLQFLDLNLLKNELKKK